MRAPAGGEGGRRSRSHVFQLWPRLPGGAVHFPFHCFCFVLVYGMAALAPPIERLLAEVKHTDEQRALERQHPCTPLLPGQVDAFAAQATPEGGQADAIRWGLEGVVVALAVAEWFLSPFTEVCAHGTGQCWPTEGGCRSYVVSSVDEYVSSGWHSGVRSPKVQGVLRWGGIGGESGDGATGQMPKCQLAQYLQGTACPPCMHAYTPFITQRAAGNALRVAWHGRGG